MSDFGLPVLKAQSSTTLVKPVSLRYHIVAAQPDVVLLADGLTGVLVKFVVLSAGQRNAEDSSQCHAVVVGGVERFLRLVRKEALAGNFDALQTN